jgi:hypothetical protein
MVLLERLKTRERSENHDIELVLAENNSRLSSPFLNLVFAGGC